MRRQQFSQEHKSTPGQLPEFLEIRALMCRFPHWTQRLWTWLTGVALPGQKPIIVWRPWMHFVQVVLIAVLAMSFATFFTHDLVSSALSFLALPEGLLIKNFLIDAIGLRVCWTLAGHAKVKAASVLVHHTGHGQGMKPKRVGIIAASAVRILMLTQSLLIYKEGHDPHHRDKDFARAGQDPDATFVQEGLGVKQGASIEESAGKLRTALRSPLLHTRLILKRLGMNIWNCREPLRTVCAWFMWAMIVVAVYPSGMLGFFSTLLIILMIPGNQSSIRELVTRHDWNIDTPPGADRQWDLSKFRFPGVLVPKVSPKSFRGMCEWAGFWASTARAIEYRLAVVPGDLHWHGGHHVGWDRSLYEGQPMWANASYAYSSKYLDMTEGKIFWAEKDARDAWLVKSAYSGPDRSPNPVQIDR